jgi:hypothetical protein
MKRPQGNILRPPGSKYLNDKKVPARFGRPNAPCRRFANRICVSQDGTAAPVAWLTKKPPLGWCSDGSPGTKPRTKYPHAARPKIADVLARLIDGNRAAKEPPQGWVSGGSYAPCGHSRYPQ